MSLHRRFLKPANLFFLADLLISDLPKIPRKKHEKTRPNPGASSALAPSPQPAWGPGGPRLGTGKSWPHFLGSDEREKEVRKLYSEEFWLVVWTPLNNISQLGWLSPIYGKIKNVPNHQPALQWRFSDIHVASMSKMDVRVQESHHIFNMFSISSPFWWKPISTSVCAHKMFKRKTLSACNKIDPQNSELSWVATCWLLNTCCQNKTHQSSTT